jgi:glycosyltransferase involved in cell wall biosynthesis
MPVVSVIIPAYNAEKTLLETIRSVIQQTHQNWELIIVDDGSEDSTLEIARGIQDDRVTTLSFANAGASVSRNRGFQQAKGEFIAFLDADDLWTPEKLEVQLSALHDHPEADVAYSWSDCIDEQGAFLRRGGHVTLNGNIYPYLLLYDVLENGSNNLVRRQAVETVKAFDPTLPAGQDWDFYLRLAQRYQFICVPKTQVLYRISTTSMSANFKQLEQGSLTVVNKAFLQAPSELQYLKTSSLENIYRYLIVKALEDTCVRSNAFTALKFLFMITKFNPEIIQAKIFYKVIIKIILKLVLGSYLIEQLPERIKRIGNTRLLLCDIKSEI